MASKKEQVGLEELTWDAENGELVYRPSEEMENERKRMTNPEAIADRDELREMITVVALTKNDIVALTKNETRYARGQWILAVHPKLNAVGVHSLRDFARSVMVLNKKLKDGGHAPIDEETLEQMFDVACDMLFGEVKK